MHYAKSHITSIARISVYYTKFITLYYIILYYIILYYIILYYIILYYIILYYIILYYIILYYIILYYFYAMKFSSSVQMNCFNTKLLIGFLLTYMTDL